MTRNPHHILKALNHETNCKMDDHLCFFFKTTYFDGLVVISKWLPNIFSPFHDTIIDPHKLFSNNASMNLVPNSSKRKEGKCNGQ